MNPKDFFYHPRLCPIPWHGAYIEPNGKVMNCAVSRHRLGNLHENSLEQILHGPVNVKVKTDQLNLVRTDNCRECYNADDLSEDLTKSYSNRSWYKKMFADSSGTGIYDSPENFDLQILDLRWRNTCNLSCVYCDEFLSSRWASEKNIKIPYVSEERIQEVKDYVFGVLDKVRHVYLAGGEPLLIKENVELLEILEQKNPNIDLRVNTNLINIQTAVFEKLQKFKNVKWTVSVDAVDEQFYYVRYPGDWKKFLDNLNFLRSTGANINFNMVWSLPTAISLFDTVDYFLDQGFHQNSFVINNLSEPTKLDIRNLSENFQDSLRQQISSRLEEYDSRYWLHKSMSSMYNFLDKKILPRPAKSILDFFDALDQKRNLSFAKTFPQQYQDLTQQLDK